MRLSRDQLVRLHKRYHTDAAIARLVGVSRQAIHRMRTAYGIAPVPKRHARRDTELARLYVAGQSGERLARRSKLSVSQVYRILKRQGVLLRNPRPISGFGARAES